MTEPTDALPEDAAHEQAAAWFARQRMHPLSESEAIEFEKWLNADPAHTRAWSQSERLWARVEGVRDDPHILAIREQARRHASERLSRARRWRNAGTLAASLTIGLAAWWGVRTLTVVPTAARASAGVKSASDPLSALIREASTRVGERSLLVLADGSKVTLNTASAVRADYSGHDRRLTLLRGEAFFDVAKDPTRPFVVTAGSRQVIAVGTEFNVRLQDQRVRVILIEGEVRVVRTQLTDSGSSARLPAGLSVTLVAGSAFVAEADGAEHVERLDADRATSWRNGRLIFEGERLADVVAEMNRYSRETLEIADPKLEGRKVSGVFEPTEGHAFAIALQAYGIARVTQETATRIVLDSP
jgi:transmembrane sensor